MKRDCDHVYFTQQSASNEIIFHLKTSHPSGHDQTKAFPIAQCHCLSFQFVLNTHFSVSTRVIGRLTRSLFENTKKNSIAVSFYVN